MAEIFTEKTIQDKTKIILTFDDHGDVLRLDVPFHDACVEAFVCTTEGGKLNDNLSQTLAYYWSDAEIFRVKASLGTPIRSHVDHGLAVPLDVEVGPVRSTVKAANRKFISFISFENIAFIYRAFLV